MKKQNKQNTEVKTMEKVRQMEKEKNEKKVETKSAKKD